MKVAIEHNGEKGYVYYHPALKKLMVVHPNQDVEDSVRDYLNNKREFSVDEKGSRMKVRAKPIQHKGFMNMALCEMGHYLEGVQANWDDPDNIEDISNVSSPGKNAPVKEKFSYFVMPSGGDTK